ncbi:hypothetical protein RRU94_23030 [Domibacillus sp. DTU_2020_1001157_1_SI_ALB_TIR_016]|uniref:hypothetical protein n=1 Tax=Domibacillus sp. DTU_2020_1001157_1_SI_ALB_TIR_016 TaxID=3077789 RepID=UPI0028E31DD1|nr:hypothetical protein [Domibacillus sp. DTU_2020_1001157_1_SI_ALB_TIR_016]WNS80353.1 hypothetical protein RRU94_23030 [Domibacillus sp. DTU_2020_1001157_1_SI_ALB_TIR_016]
MRNKKDEKEKQDENLIAEEIETAALKNENTEEELEIAKENTEQKEHAEDQENEEKDKPDNEDEDEEDKDEDGDEDEDDEDEFFEELTGLLGQSVLIITEASQLNLLGQTFRPIFCGPIVEVERGHLTIDPVTIKILNAPFFQFPTPLSIPFERIAQLTPCFDCSERFPLI